MGRASRHPVGAHTSRFKVAGKRFGGHLSPTSYRLGGWYDRPRWGPRLRPQALMKLTKSVRI
jgi:hypothetical protein